MANEGPRRPFMAGESLDRLVVRSDGDGQLIGGSCERHLVAPKAAPSLVELHGHFDAAIGPTSTDADRDRLLALGAMEAGSFADPEVPDPADYAKRVKTPGIRVAVNEDSPTPPAAMPREISEEMDEQKISLHTRIRFIELRRGREQAADDIWAAVKNTGRARLLSSALATAADNHDVTADDALAAA